MRNSLLFLILLMTSVSFAQVNTKPKGKGEMKFEKTRHNFGVFAQEQRCGYWDQRGHERCEDQADL